MAKEAKKKEKKMKDNTNKKASNKDKRHFFKDVKAELKKVIWPTPKQLLNNTLAVIASVLIVGVIVFLLDLCFEKINTFGVEKLKTIVQSPQNFSERGKLPSSRTSGKGVERTYGPATNGIGRRAGAHPLTAFQHAVHRFPCSSALRERSSVAPSLRLGVPAEKLWFVYAGRRYRPPFPTFCLSTDPVIQRTTGNEYSNN